jgi:hypothetical protein
MGLWGPFKIPTIALLMWWTSHSLPIATSQSPLSNNPWLSLPTEAQSHFYFTKQ